MKNYLRLIIFGIINLVIVGHNYSQERVNRQSIIIIKKVSDTLISAKGWAYHSYYGEWVDYQNVISPNKSYKNEWALLQGAEMKSHIEQNFNSIYTRLLDYKGTQYYDLIIEKWSGEYKYPTLRQDWVSYIQILHYIFKEEEFNKIANCINGDPGIIYKAQSFFKDFEKSRLINSTEKEVLASIQTRIESNPNPAEYGMEQAFFIYKSKEGDIRFLIPEFRSSASEIKIDEYYFETTFKNFSKIIP